MEQSLFLVVENRRSVFRRERGLEEADGIENPALFYCQTPDTIVQAGVERLLSLRVFEALRCDLFRVLQFRFDVVQEGLQGSSSFSKTPSQEPDTQRMSLDAPTQRLAGLGWGKMVAVGREQGKKEISSSFLRKTLELLYETIAPIRGRDDSRRQQDHPFSFLQSGEKGCQRLCCRMIFLSIKQRLNIIQDQQRTLMRPPMQDGLLEIDRGWALLRVKVVEPRQAGIKAIRAP